MMIDRALTIKQQVRGFDVSVNDVVLVCVGDCFCRLQPEPRDVAVVLVV